MLNQLLSYTQKDWEYLKRKTLDVTVRPLLNEESEDTFITTIEELGLSAIFPFEPLGIKFKDRETMYNFYRIKKLKVIEMTKAG